MGWSYQAMTKVYSGVFRLGEDTPSLDADTEVCLLCFPKLIH